MAYLWHNNHWNNWDCRICLHFRYFHFLRYYTSAVLFEHFRKVLIDHPEELLLHALKSMRVSAAACEIWSLLVYCNDVCSERRRTVGDWVTILVVCILQICLHGYLLEPQASVQMSRGAQCFIRSLTLLFTTTKEKNTSSVTFDFVHLSCKCVF